MLQIMEGQWDDYTTDCLLFYSYFNEHYKMIAMYLSKQQAVDADPTITYFEFFRRSNILWM